MKRNGRLAERPTLDHLTPASRMGRTSLENTAAACGGCNEDKGHLTRAEYLAVLAVRRRAAAPAALSIGKFAAGRGPAAGSSWWRGLRSEERRVGSEV